MHELAFYSGDGQAKIYRGYNGANRCTVREKARVYIRIHPTQKPVQLYKWILQNYAKEGDNILDTHSGSLSLGIACHDLGYELTAIEKDEEYYNDAKKRLELHQRQLKLF